MKSFLYFVLLSLEGVSANVGSPLSSIFNKSPSCTVSDTETCPLSVMDSSPGSSTTVIPGVSLETCGAIDPRVAVVQEPKGRAVCGPPARNCPSALPPPLLR